MKNNKLLLLIPLLLLSIIPVLPTVPRVFGATGSVCLADLTGTCGATLGGPVGSQLSVQVRIAGSDALNGFDVVILTDHTVLHAAGADLAGSIIGSGSQTIVECLGDVLVGGSTCTAADNADTLHFAVIASPGTIVGAPGATSGLLFTAIFDIVAQTPAQSLSFQTGCTGSSVPGSICVTIANGTPTPDSEMASGANFSNLSDFSLSASPTSLDNPPGTTGSSTITVTSTGGFSDFINLAATTSSASLVCSLDSDAIGGVSLPPDTSVTTMLHCSSAAAGSFMATITGTGSAFSTFVHTLTVPVKVESPNFSLSANPTSINIAPGDTGTSTVTVGSLAGFSGSVGLTAAVSGGSGLSCTVTSPVTAPGTSTLSCSGATGSYTVTVTGTSGTLTHTTTVTVSVGTSDFAFSAVPDTLAVFRIKPTGHFVSVLHLISIQNFAAPITLTTTWRFAFVDTPGDSSLPYTTTNLGSYTGTLNAGQSAEVAVNIFPVAANVGTGLYVQTITATGGGITHTVTINWWMLDFTVTPACPNVGGLPTSCPTITVINTPGTQAVLPVVVQPIGAPHNSTATCPGTDPNDFCHTHAGDAINPFMFFGPSGNAGAMAYPSEYGAGTPVYRSNNGAKFAAALGLDSSISNRRCFERVFANGNLVLPTYTGTSITSFAAPVVHYNGDQDGDPPNFNGCRFDGVWAAFPAQPDFGNVVVEPIATTPNGMFTAQLCFQVGSLIDCNNFSVRMVAPPAAPAINQFSGRGGSYSLSATGGMVTFKVGVTNQDLSTTVFAQATITAVSSDGTITIQGKSAVFQLGPGGKVNNNAVTLDFSGVPAGTTLNLSAVLIYGVDPSFTTVSSVQTVGTAGKVNGSILLTP